MIRTLPLIVIAVALFSGHAAGAQPLTNDDLHGTWTLDEKAATKDQAAAVAAAKAVESFGIVLTTRIARVVFETDGMVAGMWRLDDATATTATLVVQPRGGEERRYALTIDGERMTVAEAPGGLPLIRAKR
ncbi:MAG: hypothetical protein H0X45_07990 [Planctomycetes bacterium]|nr:hypothetical protein [Planctomycetota bacterium]